MNLVEPDLDVIGHIVDSYGDRESAAWSRYHETARGQLTMAFWEKHFEWRFLASRYQPCPLLDYGCGTAHSDVYLARAGFTVIGYEPNETNRGVAEYVVSIQEKSIQDGIVIVGAFPKTDWANLVKLVWVCHVLEHVPKSKWTEFFEPMVLSKWKTLISVPLGREHYVPSHINIWNNEYELVKDLEAFGLTVMWSGTDSGNGVIRAEIWNRE